AAGGRSAGAGGRAVAVPVKRRCVNWLRQERQEYEYCDAGSRKGKILHGIMTLRTLVDTKLTFRPKECKQIGMSINLSAPLARIGNEIIFLAVLYGHWLRTRSGTNNPIGRINLGLRSRFPDENRCNERGLLPKCEAF